LLTLALSVFGSLIVSALVARQFRGISSTPKMKGAVLAATFLCVAMLTTIHYRRIAVEILLVLVSLPVAGFGMWAAQTKVEGSAGAGRPKIEIHPIVICCVLVCLAVSSRIFQAERLSTELSGLVSSKYISHNHSSRAIVVTRSDQTTIAFEGIEEQAWNSINEGRSSINKPAWSAFGTIDGTSMRIVTKANLCVVIWMPD